MESLSPGTSTQKVELQFKAHERIIYIVIQIGGNQITDVYTTYMPPKFSLQKEGKVIDLMSIIDEDNVGEVVRVGKAYDAQVDATNLFLAREVTGNLADGTKRPVWIIDDPGIMCKSGQVVLIKEGSSFVLGSQQNTYKCFKTEPPRNKCISLINEEFFITRKKNLSIFRCESV